MCVETHSTVLHRHGWLEGVARAERFELPSTVLETAILPLNYARMNPASFTERKSS